MIWSYYFILFYRCYSSLFFLLSLIIPSPHIRVINIFISERNYFSTKIIFHRYFLKLKKEATELIDFKDK